MRSSAQGGGDNGGRRAGLSSDARTQACGQAPSCPVGRCFPLSRLQTLDVAMGMHSRLGPCNPCTGGGRKSFCSRWEGGCGYWADGATEKVWEVGAVRAKPRSGGRSRRADCIGVVIDVLKSARVCIYAYAVTLPRSGLGAARHTEGAQAWQAQTLYPDTCAAPSLPNTVLRLMCLYPKFHQGGGKEICRYQPMAKQHAKQLEEHRCKPRPPLRTPLHCFAVALCAFGTCANGAGFQAIAL